MDKFYKICRLYCSADLLGLLPQDREVRQNDRPLGRHGGPEQGKTIHRNPCLQNGSAVQRNHKSGAERAEKQNAPQEDGKIRGQKRHRRHDRFRLRRPEQNSLQKTGEIFKEDILIIS